MTTMRALLSVLIFTLSLNFGLAQSLKGIVKDAQSNEGIPLANLYFPDLQTGTATDIDGTFTYTGSLPSKTKLQISAIGYETTIIIFEATNIQQLTIPLKKAHLELKEFNVSSSTGLIEKHTVANTHIQSIGGSNQLSPTQMGQLLNNIPSVYEQSAGLGISKPVIRGLSGTRVVTLLNGLRIENQQWGSDHGMAVTSLGVSGLEVIKGPSALLYGADALGGVLYFKDEAYAAQNTFEAFASSRFESNTMGSQNQVGIKINRNNIKVNLFGSLGSMADYQLPDGSYAQNSRFNSKDLKGAIGYHKGNWVSNFRYNFSNARIGIPGHTHDTLINVNTFKTTEQSRSKTIPAQLISNHLALFENSFFFKNSDLKIAFGYTSNRLREFEEKFTIPGIDLNLSNRTLNARYTKQIGTNSNLVSGIQAMHQTNRNGDKALEILIPNANTTDLGAYTLFRRESKGFTWQTGIRYDIRQLKSLTSFEGSPAIDKSYYGVNYSIGAVKVIKKLTFRTNISTGFRPPQSSELLANGVHHGTLRFEKGNSELVSERATQIDVSAAYQAPHFDFNINPYINLLSNFITISPDGTMMSGLPVFNYIQPQHTEIYGTDVSMHWHPHKIHQLHLEHTFSVIRGIDENKNPLPLMPQTRFNTQAKWEFNNKGLFRIENILLQHLLFLKQDQVAYNETASPSYNLVHIGANFTWQTKTPLHIQLGVRNLLNENYIDHLSRLKNIGLEAPGRNFFISVKMNLNHKFK